jgi:hypothetical protein
MRVVVLSDIHYASAQEQARGSDFEVAAVVHPLGRRLLRWYRRFIWLREPLQKNYLLDRFLERCRVADWVVANGDFACNTASVGLSDDAACQSARECLDKLRGAFGERFRATFGDHELGKVSFVGGRGGMRLASWHRARNELRLEPFWQVNCGRYRLMGVASSLVALPIFQRDTLPEELPEWERLRSGHMADIRQAFAGLAADERVLLFCHDPTALPFLLELPEVGRRVNQIEQTIIGHLHSNLVLWASRRLAGLPRLDFLGHSARRMSSALRQGRLWRPFNVRLCPALAGIELLKDGGYFSVELDPQARMPAQFRLHPIPR